MQQVQVFVIAALALLATTCMGAVSVSAPTAAPPVKLPNNATVRWTFNTTIPGEVVINPFVKGELVFVPTNASLYTFNIVTGELLWQFAVPVTSVHFKGSDNGGYVGASDDTVFLGTMKAVYAFTSRTGVMVWAHYLQLPANRPNPTRHARADYLGTHLYITTFNSPLFEVNPETGATLRVIGSGVSEEHVHLADGRIFFLSIVNGTRYLWAADQATGKLLWNISGLVNIEVAHGLVYVRYSAAVTQTMRAVNQSTAETVWEQTIPGIRATFDDFIVGRSFFTASSLINDAYPNTLTAYNPTTGQKRWDRIIGFFYLLAGEGAVFAFGTVTQSRAYSAETGDLLWNYDGIAVNDGAVGLNTVVFGTATQIVALKVW